MGDPFPFPVHAGGHQLNGGGVHRVDGALEAVEQPLALAAAGKARVQALEMFQDRPEQLLGQDRVAVLVGVGEIVAGGRGGPAQGRERPGVQPQRVTDIVESEGVGQLRVEQRDDVAPRREGAGLLVHPRRRRQLGN